MTSRDFVPDDANYASRSTDAALIAAVCYFVLAALTIHLTSDGRSHATVWIADGVILAQLLHHERRVWPAILAAGWIANLAANAVTRGWSLGIVPYGAINMAQTAIAALILTRRGPVTNILRDIPTVALFIVSTGIVAPLLGAIAGSAVSAANYGEEFWPQVVRWAFSNGLGYLIVTPCLSALFNGDYRLYFKGLTALQRSEALILQLSHAITCFVVFGLAQVPLLFLPYTTMMLLAFRTGENGIKLGVVSMALIGAVETFMGHGPLNMIGGSAELRDFYFQIYIAFILLTVLPVGAVTSMRTEDLQSLAERDAALKLMMAQSSDVVLAFDGAGVCRLTQGPVNKMIGVAPAMMLGRDNEILCLLAPPALSQFLDAVSKGECEPAQRLEFAPLLRSHLTLEASAAAMERTADVAGLVIVLRDITQRKAIQRAEMAEAQTDELTGVLTRQSFRRRASVAAAESGRPSCLAIVEIDQFKSIHENYGYEIGNVVLAEIARLIGAHLRETDIIGRVGHDEFAIHFAGDLQTARAVCERLIDTVRSNPAYTRDTVSIITSISCGLTRWDQTIGLDEAFEAADRALREIKRSGRNGILIAA